MFSDAEIAGVHKRKPGGQHQVRVWWHQHRDCPEGNEAFPPNKHPSLPLKKLHRDIFQKSKRHLLCMENISWTGNRKILILTKKCGEKNRRESQVRLKQAGTGPSRRPAQVSYICKGHYFQTFTNFSVPKIHQGIRKRDSKITFPQLETQKIRYWK